jgi:small-conductance mechanosensitive channel
VDAANLRESLNASLQTLGNEAAARLPGLIVALLLLIAGWIIARIARAAVQRLLDSVQKSIARRSGRPEIDTAGAERVSARVLSGVVFWAVILLFAATATQIIGLDLFTKWMASIVKHVPGVAAGLIIIAAGFVASGFVGDLVRSSARRLQETQQGALARVAQTATLLVAVLVGADQIGLEVRWLAILVAVVVGVTLGGAALAVSLGSRHFVGNAIGAHYMRQSFRVGERVKVMGYEGRIIDININSVVLQTEAGRVNIPAGVYSSAAIELLSDERSEST